MFPQVFQNLVVKKEQDPTHFSESSSKLAEHLLNRAGAGAKPLSRQSHRDVNLLKLGNSGEAYLLCERLL